MCCIEYMIMSLLKPNLTGLRQAAPLHTSGIFLDLETTILGPVPHRRPGTKRFETRIIEVGAVSADASDEYNVLVAPLDCSELSSGGELIDALSDIHQHPWRTIHFWTRVLVQRGTIQKQHMPKTPKPQADMLLDFMKTAKDKFDTWCETNPEPKDHADKLVWASTCKINLVPERIALLQLEQFSKKHGDIWHCHNGRSFDFKVLEGAYQRANMKWTRTRANAIDTIPLFKKWTGNLHASYSQPKLYGEIFKEKYSAHIALEDARALHRLYHALSRPDTVPKPVPQKVVKPSTRGKRVRSLRGVGEKTEAKWAEMNIHTVEDLKEVCSSMEWLKKNIPRGVSAKRIWNQIRP